MSELSDRALNTVQRYMGSIVARSVLEGAASQCGFTFVDMHAGNARCLADAVEKGIHTFIADQAKADECSRNLKIALGIAFEAGASAAPAATAASSASIMIPIGEEFDIVVARSKTKGLCAEMGFPLSLQIKVATVVSELARNIVQYVGSGSIELKQVKVPREGIEILAVDQGAGISNLDTILSGEYKSPTGMGMGLCGASKMMHEFKVDTQPGRGTRVFARMYAA